MSPCWQPAGPSLTAVYRQERLKCVTQLAPIKDNVITALLLLSTYVGGRKSTCLSWNRGCWRTMNWKAACARELQPYVALIFSSPLHSFVNKQQLTVSVCFLLFAWKQEAGYGGSGEGKGRGLHTKPKVNLPGAMYTSAVSNVYKTYTAVKT